MIKSKITRSIIDNTLFWDTPTMEIRREPITFTDENNGKELKTKIIALNKLEKKSEIENENSEDNFEILQEQNYNWKKSY